MSKAFAFYLRGNIMGISCACVCFFYTTFRCFFLVFYPARVPACSGVVWVGLRALKGIY